MMADLKSAWRAGDKVKLAQVALTPMRKEYPDLYKSLLVECNNTWLAHIEDMLATSDTEFVLVGALHLIGKRRRAARVARAGLRGQALLERSNNLLSY